MILFRGGSGGQCFGLVLGCGQDREGPLTGRAGSYEVTPSWSSVVAGGGRRIVRRPAECGSRLGGQAAPGAWASAGAWAHLCAAAPIPASSGKVNRHRLNPHGDRQANHALWQIVITRMSSHPATRAYVARRTKEGLSKKEIIRCLKRYDAREVYPYQRG